MFPLSRRCRNTLIRVLRWRIFAPDKEFCHLRAAAKGVLAGRSSQNVWQKIYMAIQIVWRRRNEVFIAVLAAVASRTSVDQRGRPLRGRLAARCESASQAGIWKPCCTSCRSVATRMRLGLVLHERSEPKLVVLSGLPGCLLIENHALQRCADIGHAPGDQQAFGLLAWFTLNDFEQPCRGRLHRLGGDGRGGG